jgi:outer membrane protein TolC
MFARAPPRSSYSLALAAGVLNEEGMYKLAAFVLMSFRLAAQFPASPPAPPTARPNLSPDGALRPDAFQSSVASGKATPDVLRLSLQEAIDRGLRTNLGLLTLQTGNRVAQAERIRSLSALLPSVAGETSETVSQINLASFGFHFPGVPTVIGPFAYSDARVSAGQTVFDWTTIKNRRAASESERAARLSAEDGRDLVIQSVSSAYLQIIAAAARVDATRAQVDTAQALYERARDQHRAGISPAIDELRAQVELKSQQQQLLAQENQFARDKLILGRVIGLPYGQLFELSDAIQFSALEGLTVEQLLQRAYESRLDYRASQLDLRAAESARQAAAGQRYPSLTLAGNYGDIGVNFARSHGTFTFTGSLRFNVFDGGRIRADVMQADAIVKQRRDELGDLQGQIDFQVRTAMLDLKTAADQVAVAQSNVELANQTLTQARDRFVAGVTDNIEVVQAQQSVAAANQNLISAIYSHNIAKVNLGRATAQIFLPASRP